MFQTLNINVETGEYQFTSPEGQMSEVPFPELPMKISRVNPYDPVKFDANIAVDVAALPMSAKMSKGRIDSMVVGPPEDYRAHIGLYDEGSPRIALWTEYKDGVGRKFEFLAGGNPVNASFCLDLLGGHDLI